MRRAVIIVAVVLALVAVLAAVLRTPVAPAVPAVSTGSPADPGPQPDATKLPPLPAAVAEALRTSDAPIIAWTAHAGGRLEPCGCTAGMHGGLVRRASLLTRVARDRVLVAEGGGWNAGRADYQQVRSRFFLDGLVRSGCDVVALGAAEAALGAERLRPLIDHARTKGLPLVAAHLQDAAGRPVTATVTTVTTGSRRYAVTAVAEGTPGDGLRCLDPVEAVLAVQRTVRDPLIVLADLDAAGLQRLARAVPGLAAVIGGSVHDPSPAPVKTGACRVVWAANEGKTLGWWLPTADACTFELITEAVPDHPQMRTLVRDYQERIAGMDIQLDERIAGLTTLGAGGGGATYAGDTACLACHQEAHRIHAASGHAHALESLVKRNYHHDPDCLRCHVTGLGLPDGWSRKAPRPGLGAVSCESCHGRGSIHVAERQAKKPSTGSLTPVTPASCRKCHDAENSPRFDHATYWKKIAHE